MEQLKNNNPGNTGTIHQKSLEKIYQYRDKNGNLKMLNLRYSPKGFRPRYAIVEKPAPKAYDDPHQWSKTKPEGFIPPLYHEDEIARNPGQTVYFCEGEKDADNLRELGYLVSCHKTVGGSILSGNGLMKDREIVIVRDNDDAGKDYAEKAFKMLASPEEDARSVKTIVPPMGKDFSDWLDLQDNATDNSEIRKRFESWEYEKSWTRKEELWNMANFWQNPPRLAPELISKLLRQGHKMAIMGPSKSGKSFLLIQLALALSEGKLWMNSFQCKAVPVLYVNLEIDGNSMIHRIVDVKNSLDLEIQNQHNFHILNLRGHEKPDIAEFIIEKAKECQAGVIIIDPIYKLGIVDENNAGDVSDFCKKLDRITEETGAAVIYCHHYSKGLQAGKDPMDRGSGSGVFARDTDALLSISELDAPKDKGKCYRMEYTLREFPTPAPLSIRFDHPLHIPDTELDKCPLKGDRSKINTEESKQNREKKKTAERQKNQEDIISMAKEGPLSKTVFISKVMQKLNIGSVKARGYVECLIADGKLIETQNKKNSNQKLISI